MGGGEEGGEVREVGVQEEEGGEESEGGELETEGEWARRSEEEVKEMIGLILSYLRVLIMGRYWGWGIIGVLCMGLRGENI